MDVIHSRVSSTITWMDEVLSVPSHNLPAILNLTATKVWLRNWKP
jgi:nitrogenase molybdenum-iron protein alpha/beta subunit